MKCALSELLVGGDACFFPLFRRSAIGLVDRPDRKCWLVDKFLTYCFRSTHCLCPLSPFDVQASAVLNAAGAMSKSLPGGETTSKSEEPKAVESAKPLSASQGSKTPSKTEKPGSFS